MRRGWGLPGRRTWLVGTAWSLNIHAQLLEPHRVHEVEKATITQAHPRRDATCEVQGWALCPAEVGGGCCPNNYKCDVSSCYATTAGPTTACGREGYYNCPIDAGPGSCCPVGLICAKFGGACVAPEGVSMSICPANYNACPASLGSGCCRSGMACGNGFCYSTALQTYTVSVPLTTTDSSGSTTTRVVTTTTVVTPKPGATNLGGDATENVMQLRPSTIAKLPAVETGNSGGGGGGGGLSQAALGGIIGGSVGLLAVILIATWMILRRLKKTQKAAEEAAAARREPSKGTGREKTLSFGQPTVTEIYAQDGTDPLQSPSLRPSYFRTTSEATAGDSSPAPTSQMRTSGRSTPYGAWPGQYNPVPTSEAPDSRRQSVETFQAYDVRYAQHVMQQQPRQETPPLHQRAGSHDSQMTSAYPGRHMSYSSELEGMHGWSELETESTGGGRHRSSSAARAISPSHSHRGSVELPGSPRMRSDSGTAVGGNIAGSVGTGLVTVNEISELHGYYGPQSHAAGQTAARLDTYPSIAPTAADASQAPPSGNPHPGGGPSY
ncbi:uncharacterized protein B0I36DRAFT_3274 [Microdochium trichocladiopsis]|uniref:Uncharacterized protein n=1 Tax=Microdochium trichocladiopsis TaxID=1682393 RepID=A0A9P8YGE0_9PEZI|nr:uncharacterized protein B0I36DRAFT_3274 [Microdochium trichocladiopsis]KAH7039904.1 hypothetical protein B0I36DRAFT_3274 [Microdochium trichocladiopsis]